MRAEDAVRFCVELGCGGIDGEVSLRHRETIRTSKERLRTWQCDFRFSARTGFA